jgi:hypothetical protein
MKVVKFIMATMLGVLFTVLSLVMVALLAYNLLPDVLTIKFVGTVRDAVMTVIPEVHFATVAWGLLGGWTFITILFIIITWNYKAKFTNVFIGIVRWVGAILIIGMSVTIFIMADIASTGVQIRLANKIGIGVMLGAYVLIRLFGKKINQIIERKLIAYDTAMETKQIGRSNPLVINILKVVQFMFPEIIMVGFLMFMLDVSFAMYFASILIAVGIIIVLGCWQDMNKRREAKRRLLQDKVNHVKAMEHIIKTGQAPK